MKANHALACDFAHTTAAPDITFTFASGTSPVTVTLPTGTYRMWLAPSANCYLRALAAAITTQVSSARGATYTCIASLSADGIASLRLISAAGLPTGVTFAAPMWRRLGYSAASPTLSPGSGLIDIGGALPVWHLALLAAAVGDRWQPLQAGGSEQTTGGRVYSIAASNTTYERRLKVSFQPSDPTYRVIVGSEATPLYPDGGYFTELGSTATAREWSILDVLQACRNAPCAVAIGNWQTLRTDTTTPYRLVDVGPDTVLSPEVTAHSEEWGAYEKWVLHLVGTGAEDDRA
jgi:hypothetical protein